MEAAVLVQHIIGDDIAGVGHALLLVPQGLQAVDQAVDVLAGIAGVLEAALLIHLLAVHRVIQQGVAGGDVSGGVIGLDPDDLAPGAVVIDLAGLLVHIDGLLIGEGDVHGQAAVFVEGIRRQLLGVDLGLHVIAHQPIGEVLITHGALQPADGDPGQGLVGDLDQQGHQLVLFIPGGQQIAVHGVVAGPEHAVVPLAVFVADIGGGGGGGHVKQGGLVRLEHHIALGILGHHLQGQQARLLHRQLQPEAVARIENSLLAVDGQAPDAGAGNAPDLGHAVGDVHPLGGVIIELVAVADVPQHRQTVVVVEVGKHHGGVKPGVGIQNVGGAVEGVVQAGQGDLVHLALLIGLHRQHHAVFPGGLVVFGVLAGDEVQLLLTVDHHGGGIENAGVILGGVGQVQLPLIHGSAGDMDLGRGDVQLHRQQGGLHPVAAGHPGPDPQGILPLAAQDVLTGGAVIAGAVPGAVPLGAAAEQGDGRAALVGVHGQGLGHVLPVVDLSHHLAVLVQNVHGDLLGAAQQAQNGLGGVEVAVAVGREGDVLGIGGQVLGVVTGIGFAGRHGGDGEILIVIGQDVVLIPGGQVHDPLAAVPVAVEAHHRHGQVHVALQGHESLHKVVFCGGGGDGQGAGDLGRAACGDGDGGLVIGHGRAGQQLHAVAAVGAGHVGIHRRGGQAVAGGGGAAVGQGQGEGRGAAHFLQGHGRQAVISDQHAVFRGGQGVDHAAALLAHGEDDAAVIDGVGGVHQGVLHEGVQAGIPQHQAAVGQGLLQALQHQGGAAGHIGGGHGGAAHLLVLLALGHGENVAAGGGDLGLDVQGGGGAPAGEGGHLAAGGLVGIHHVVQAVEADLGPGCRQLHELCAGAAADHHGRVLAGAFGGHVGGHLVGGLVVIHDHGGGVAHTHQIVDLILEGDVLAPLDQGHIGLVGQGGQLGENVLEQVTVAELQNGDLPQGGPVGVIALGEVRDHAAVHGVLTAGDGHGFAPQIGVVHGGHAEGPGIGGGAGHRTGVDDAPVVGVVIAIGPVGGGAAVVTGGHAHHHAVLLGVGQGLLQIVRVVIESGGAAQAQVQDVGPQLHGVLHRPDDVVVIGAAGVAEHLHGKDLSVGGNARHAAVLLVAVGGDNAGDVQAVGDHLIADVLLAHIAVAEGDLVGVILAIAQGGDFLGHIRLGILQLGVLAHLHIGVGVVHAAVDNGHHDALAGIAAIFSLPQLHGAGHVLGGGHPGLIGGDLADGYHAVQSRHLLHLRAGHVHGKGADQIPGLVDHGIAGDAPGLPDDALLGAQDLTLGRLDGGGVVRVPGLLHGGGHIGDHHGPDHLIGVLPGVHVHNGALPDGVLQPLHIVIAAVGPLGGQRRDTQRHRQRQRQAQGQCPPEEPVYKGVFFHIFPPE